MAKEAAKSYPDDLWFAVFEKVSSDAEVRNLRLVCPRFEEMLSRRPLFDRKAAFRLAFQKACRDGNLEAAKFLSRRHSGWGCSKYCVVHGSIGSKLVNSPVWSREIGTIVRAQRGNARCMDGAFIVALSKGHFELGLWLLEQVLDASKTVPPLPSLVDYAIDVAAWSGSVTTLQRVFETMGSRARPSLARVEDAIRRGHDNVVQWSVDSGLFRDPSELSQLLSSALSYGNFGLASWLLDGGVDLEKGLDQSCIDQVSVKGNLIGVEWLHRLTGIHVSQRRITDCSLEVVRWWHAVDPSWFESDPQKLGEFLLRALRRGKLDLAKWLVSIGASAHEAVECHRRHDVWVEPLYDLHHCWEQDGLTENLQWLLGIQEFKALYKPDSPAKGALQSGDMPLLVWLWENGHPFPDGALGYAVFHQPVEVLRWLWDKGFRSRPHCYFLCRGQNFETVGWFLEHCFPPEEDISSKADLVRVVEDSDMTMLRFLCDARPGWVFPELAIDSVAGRGELEKVKFLTQRGHPCSFRAFDYAAAGGHLEVVKWLHENRTEGCSTEAFEFACLKHHPEVAQWLVLHRPEMCTVEGLEDAAATGQLSLVKWLRQVAKMDFGNAKKAAKYNGHFDTWLWIRKNRSIEP